MAKILIVDDEANIVELEKLYLRREGYQVESAGNACDALALSASFNPDLIILDIMLPDRDGLEVCKQIRINNDVPILMLSARREDVDRIVGLELGADDYIAKPYNPRELLARIKAIQRRMQAGGTNAPVRYLKFRNFCMDLTQRLLTHGAGERVILTSMDFNLLRIFAEHAGETLERGRLMELTRGRDLGPLDRSLDVQISRLRQRLQDDGKQPELIKTVRGSGYVFSTEVSSHSEA